MDKVFRDPVHDLIRFDRVEDALVLRLIDTPHVQRLRHIRQLGTGSMVYPSATHSRFSHALGTAFLMKRVVDHLLELAPSPSLAQTLTEHRQLLLAAALLHDVGHLPFSHLLEDFTQIPHETWTVRLVRHPQTHLHRVLTEANPRYPEQIAQLFNRTFKPAFAVKLLSSQLDVDRMEYLVRDSLCTGVTYGYFDVNWLIHSLRLVQENDDWELAIDRRKGLHAAEGYVLARYYMYQQVYHHKTARAADVLMRKTLQRAADLLRAGHDLPMTPPLRKLLLRPAELSLDDHLALDDTVVLFAVKEWCAAPDPILSDLAQRFQQRRLFKTLDLDESQYREHADKLAQLARAAGFDPRYYLALDRVADDPYKESYFLKGLLAGENIFLVDSDGALVELSQASDVIRAVRNKTYVQDRLCFPEELRDQIVALCKS
ncbi:MAG: HD domain-containing protein [Candidatus Bipolaricaulota bacterium]|nr:HD domain-containing protein [Candidatus Bipolaricaulota bacterium]MCS7274771.1 HD domain-containing protein [Candidatus Bipolaricaulota bacterium]MDW8110051.1 HD domain-containing protein [Candidatus Bipolaricaulota bacterium]MDW8329476.1 HD domain-containing protein [Candidatus Bipolaricaulota bacterium]